MSYMWKKTLSTLQISRDYTVRPVGLRWRSNTLFIIATVGVGLFTDLFLYGLVVPILPFILEDRIGLPQSELQSHTSGLLAAYAAASVAFSPVAGLIADKTSGRQTPFLAGLAALLLATLGLYLGQTIAALAIARVLQGISGGFVWTIGLALCLDTVGPENLGKTIGSIFGFISVGELAAPTLGGVLYDKAGYGGVFGVAAGVLGVDFIMRLLVIEKKVAARYEPEVARPDANAQSSDDGDDGGEDEGGQDTNNQADEEDPLLGKKVEKSYVIEDPKSLSRMVRKFPILYCFRDTSLLAALLVAFVQASLLGAFDATVATVGKEYFGFGSLEAGLLFLPLGIVNFVVGPIAGWAVDRFGTRPVATFGYGVLVPILVSLRAVHPGGKDQIVVYCVLLGLCGIGLGAVGAPSIVEAGAVVQRYHKANVEFFGEGGPYAQLYGANSMIFSAGLTLGPIIAGGLKDAIGYGNMNAAIALMCFITSVVCFIFLGGRPRVFSARGLHEHARRYGS